MTGQAHDTLSYDGTEYAIVGAGAGLFDPTALGLRPIPLNTATWRGYQCRYAVRDDRLHLQRLRIGLEAAEAPPLVFDTAPSSVHGIEVTYEFGSAAIPYSGTLLLGNGLITELYVHMGFQPAWRFQDVLELTFQEGRLLDQQDRTAENAELRRLATSERGGDPIDGPFPSPHDGG